MSAEVREMFASIARRYDTANEILSLGIHKGWRRAAVGISGAGRGQRVLDCATGTGDLALEFKRAVGAEGEVIARTSARRCSSPLRRRRRGWPST